MVIDLGVEFQRICRGKLAIVPSSKFILLFFGARDVSEATEIIEANLPVAEAREFMSSL